MLYSGFLSSGGINWVASLIANAFSDICSTVRLPNPSHEGRISRAMIIGKPSTGTKRKVLILGGVHAREWVNPDALLNFAYALCKAYKDGTGLVFGGQSYNSTTVKLVVDGIDLVIFPLVNPDGRQYSLSVDNWWRKNRRPAPTGSSCMGVDINRNFDFLWSSGIGTSTNPCSSTYKGPSTLSEPETRNVVHLLDSYPEIRVMADIHSYSQLILYPWGDDNNQSTDPSHNFTNPAFDGLRGILNSGYREYQRPEDRDWYLDTGSNIQEAIENVRGRLYTLEESSDLYPTTGTTKDYSYSRHIADASKGKIYGFTLETGTTFFPSETEAGFISLEVAAGVMELCLAGLCGVEATTTTTTLASRISEVQAIQHAVLESNPAAQKAFRMIQKNTPKVLISLQQDKQLLKQWQGLIEKLVNTASKQSNKDLLSLQLDENLVEEADQFLVALTGCNKKDKGLKQDLAQLRKMLPIFKKHCISEALVALS